MIANIRLYLLISLGLIPLILLGLAESFMPVYSAGRSSLITLEPVILKLVMFYDIVLLLVLVIDYFLSIRSTEVIVTREISEKLSINRLNPVKLSFVNFSSQLLKGVVKDGYPDIAAYHFTDGEKKRLDKLLISLSPASKGEFTYYLHPTYRGEYEFQDIYIRYLSRFRLFWRQIRIKSVQKVKVYPDLMGLQELSFKLSRSSEIGETKIRRMGDGTEFSSLKDYISGDDIRHMDWRATARKDHPIIRTYEVSKEQTILILIDGGRMMSTELSGLSRFDWGVNAALSLSLAALAKGDHVGIGVFSDTPKLFIPPKRGKVSIKNIIEGIHAVQPVLVEPDYMGMLANFASLQKKRALIVVITDLIDAIASETLLKGLAYLSPRHLPFCVTFNDKKVLQMANSHVASVDDVYNQAVSIDLLEQRKQALNILVRRGGLVLDVPPEELNTAIVDKYLTIKAKNLI